jgi:DNA polymerase I
MSVIVTDQNYHAIVKKLITNDEKVSKGSNLQNIPARGDGERVRRAFKPPVKDGEQWFFISSDLGQIEPRIMAHIMYDRYNDNSMRQIFVDGVDLYSTMAMMTFNLSAEYCTDKAYDPTGTFKPRAMMKTGVLAVSYDQKPDAFAMKMGVSTDVAHMFFEEYDRAFPSFKQMVKDIREEMAVKGYSETIYGRKRRFPQYAAWKAESERNEAKLMGFYRERKKLRMKAVKTAADFKRLDTLEEMIAPLAEMRNMVSYWERASFNSVIQGTGADVLKKNMIAIKDACMLRNWELNATIHDEVKVAVPKRDLTEESVQIINDCMTKTCGKDLTVPLISDTVIEPCWSDEYKPKDWDFANACPKVSA